eukprot:3005612-Rhodomonas_salina.2
MRAHWRGTELACASAEVSMQPRGRGADRRGKIAQAKSGAEHARGSRQRRAVVLSSRVGDGSSGVESVHRPRASCVCAALTRNEVLAAQHAALQRRWTCHE